MNSFLRNQTLFVIGILVVLTSCRTQKEITWGTMDFSVTSASEQLFVPGIEDAEPYTVLTFTVSPKQQETVTVAMDSIEFRGKMAPINLTSNQYKVNMKIGTTLGDQADTTISENQAIIYYTKEKTRYKYLVESIKKLETMYMP